MYKIKCSFVIALLLFSYSIVSSQTVPKSTITKAATQCKWVGTVRYTATEGIDGIDGFELTETTTGTVTFELDHSDEFGEYYNLSEANLTWSASGTFTSGDISCTG